MVGYSPRRRKSMAWKVSRDVDENSRRLRIGRLRLSRMPRFNAWAVWRIANSRKATSVGSWNILSTRSSLYPADRLPHVPGGESVRAELHLQSLPRRPAEKSNRVRSRARATVAAKSGRSDSPGVNVHRGENVDASQQQHLNICHRLIAATREGWNERARPTTQTCGL